MSRQSELFSFCVGGLALVSTVISIAVFLRGYLPSAQIKVLDEVYDETKMVFEQAIADGLLTDEIFRATVQRKLDGFQESRECLRRATFRATTSLDEVKALWGGVSKKIIDLAAALKKLRRCVITTSEMERAKRRSQASVVPSECGEISTDARGILMETISTSSSIDADLDFSSLADSAPHDSINCSVCLSGIKSCPPERDLCSESQTELPDSQELPGLPFRTHHAPQWSFSCLPLFVASKSVSRAPDETPSNLELGTDLSSESHYSIWSFLSRSLHRSIRGRGVRPHESSDVASLSV